MSRARGLVPFAALALAALAAPAAPVTPAAPAVPAALAGDPDERPAARVAVDSGRATLYEGEAQRALVPSERPHRVAGAGRLVLGPGARAELSWPRRASLRLAGPVEIAWGADGADALEARVDAGGTVQWEVRAGRARMELADFALDAGVGVVALRGKPGGAVDAVHHGGEAVRIRSLVARPPATWPARLRAGGRVRLEPVREDRATPAR